MAKAPTVVITEFMAEAAVDRLRQAHTTHHDPALVDAPEQLARWLGQARALIVRNRTQVSAALLTQAPQLSVIGRLGVGLDNIDLAAGKARGIEVIPAKGANDDAVAEYVIAGCFLLQRAAFAVTEPVAAGVWPRQASVGQEIAGKTLGLLGFGGTAQAVAKRAAALGMVVRAHDPALAADDSRWSRHGIRPAAFEAVLETADVASLHVPLTPTTENLLDAQRLRRMKRGACLINAARGGVVDEAALVACLRAGHLGGALLDVFAQEPLSSDNPFRDVPNLWLTPHIAGVTKESNMRVSEAIADAVLAHLARRT